MSTCKCDHTSYIDRPELWRTIEDTIELQFNSARNAINLSAKTFNRDVFKLLYKNLNFIPMQNYFNKTIFFLTKLMDFIEQSNLKHT